MEPRQKRKEAFNEEYGCHREHGHVFCLPGGTTCFFCGLLCAVHSTWFQFSTGKILEIQNPAGFDDKSARSWSFSTGGVLKLSMGSGFLEPQTTSLKMDVFFGETAKHFLMCKDLESSSSNGSKTLKWDFL